MLELKTGKWKRKWKFQRKYFIEGSCVLEDRFFILTWMEHICFVFSLKNPENKLKEIGRPSYPTEGWGLTTDGKIIDPETGIVTDYIDCTGLLPDKLRTKTTDVLNGIARDPSDGSIYVTGKYWPRLYKISY